MHGLMADGAGGAWTFGSSILTFAFPMILFIVVAGALYVLYTKPESVPGHSAPGLQRSVSYTAVPGKPAAGRAVQATAAQARPAASGTAGIVPAATEATSAEAPSAEEAPRTEAPSAEEPPRTGAPSTEDGE